jgi:hypothetical protein
MPALLRLNPGEISAKRAPYHPTAVILPVNPAVVPY